MKNEQKLCIKYVIFPQIAFCSVPCLQMLVTSMARKYVFKWIQMLLI